MAETLKDLFDHELRDLYDAEKKLTRAVSSMSKKVKDPRLKGALEDHQAITEEQVVRLEQVFAAIGMRPRREPCKGINGLIEEFTHFTQEEKPAKPVLDLFAVGSAKKVEQYEIMAYTSLIEMAEKLGYDDIIEPLQKSLGEEEEAFRSLEGFTHLSDKVELGEIELDRGKAPIKR